MQPIVNIALRAARLGGEQIARAAERLDLIKSEQSSAAEFISETCSQVERTIAQSIQKAYPHHTLQGAFSGRYNATGEGPVVCDWQISPVDSLINFSNGLPVYALSLTGRINGRTEHCVVINPVTGEEFTASRGNGAQLNGRRLRVSSSKQLHQALLGCGFVSGNNRELAFAEHQKQLYRLTTAGAHLFSSGSALLNLAYTAAGRLDGFFQADLSEAEMEAGLLLIQEAGGLVGDYKGGNAHRKTGSLVAANPKMFKLLVKTLQTAD
ncbi:Inositol-1-monophosphatase [Nitrincola lacisaponensis]|uniref:Inositol-1-monophosphatase n=1 Tax=Nitrincola lacisaponensis TaxID=267850 RepID=A0A063Y745_9GAMM|nr:inositol monophosphatase family protein [Nitrincola lacisaponensis]KDE40576.1 Inositol-1-monophosphatase [Nitrincola lacisaponensis]